MYQLAANLELLFTEAGSNYIDRAKAAADAGFKAVEIWGTSNKDVSALASALGDLGLTLTSMVVEPRSNLVFPGTDHQQFFDGLSRSLEHALQLNCRRMVISPGLGFPGAKRRQNLDKLVEVYSQVMERVAQTNVTILHEPVNTRVDHPGVLVDRTADALTVIRAINSPKLRLLYDFYHSVVEGETPATELANAADVLEYVQFADAPGRGEPGSGTIDWPWCFALLRKVGYSGPIGLEYVPTTTSLQSVQHILKLARSTETTHVNQ